MTRLNRSISLTLCLFSLIGTLKTQVSQAPSPTKSPSVSDASTKQSPAFQLTVKVRRVVLDVVVTDAKGTPVEGLKKEDFKVLEDGVMQPLRFFDVHNSTAASPRAPELHLPQNTFSNLALAPSDKPVTVLLYDMLNTPQTALPLAHQALVKFIKDQKSSTQIAVFVLTDRLHMVQGFTDDETRLMASVDLKNNKSQISQMRSTEPSGASSSTLFAADTTANAAVPQQPGVTTVDQGVDPTARPSTTGARSGGAATPVGADMVLEMLNGAEEAESSYLLRQRLETTVNAFANIARFVSALPGRKNLIWLSGSFPSEIMPNSTQAAGGQHEFGNATFLEDDVRVAQQVLKDSRVAIYPVDVRGLQVDTQFSAGSRFTAPPPKASTFGVEEAAEHATMDAVADSTGGRAFYNTNGLQQAMDAAVHQGSDYYSLTYAPSNTKEDGAERTIKVVLKDPNYQLFYRRRYLADDAAHPSKVPTLVLDMNMQHGAPNSSELFFEAKVNPLGGSMVASAQEIETLKTFLQTKVTGKRTKISNDPINVQHYDINFAIIGRQLQMPPTGSGKYATNMTFGLGAYTRESELLNGMEVSIKNSIPPAQYQKIESDGYHASMIFVVPVEAVSLRLAVRDEIGNRIGTMEIPLPIPVPKNTAAAATPMK